MVRVHEGGHDFLSRVHHSAPCFIRYTVCMHKVLKFVRSRTKTAILILLVIGTVIFNAATGDDGPQWTTDTVTTGTVRQIVSVSGAVDAVGHADLGFPITGTIESIAVAEGDTVTKGQTLATLVHTGLEADYQEARAALLIAEADRAELISGQTPEELRVSQTNAEIAREELARVTREQDERVTNARRTLLSSDLEARPNRGDNGDIAPTITGTYTCGEGTYLLDIFSSRARSGYSYTVSGLERGTYTAYTETSAPLGSCGLRIQFAAGESYSPTTWTIAIPNTGGASYTANLNAYNLAVTQRENLIREAEQRLALAEQTLARDTAVPRSEARTRAEATVLQAQARLNAIQAQIDDHVITAPFDGTITHIEPVVGETVSNAPVITMVSPEAFTLTALIPEIDITKILPGQKAEVLFDARAQEILPATVTFISPLAKEIDGVSYFEATLVLDTDVPWMRGGLNADIDILIEVRESVTRLPKRYVTEENGVATVRIPHKDKAVSIPVEIVFSGNDGFVEIKGLPEGTTVIAP